jgi:hypothetical protein
LVQNIDKAVIAWVAFFILTLTEVNPVWLIILSAALGFIIYR